MRRLAAAGLVAIVQACARPASPPAPLAAPRAPSKAPAAARPSMSPCEDAGLDVSGHLYLTAAFGASRPRTRRQGGARGAPARSRACSHPVLLRPVAASGEPFLPP